ncbi:MAG: FAD-binding oxidoreductase [Phycicoccus sp.]|nr:FAD-binding oxidoreductase [Phycicoccus sp.]
MLASLADAFDDEHRHNRPIDLAARAHDASHYLLNPVAAVTARSASDVAAVIALGRRHAVPVTFRSGGTSLSGQASGSGILVDTRRSFRGVEVLDDGARVRCEPGATVRAVNARLAPHGRVLGPDPASEIACTIGGVVANNSSGMACGTSMNTYATLESIVVVLPSGTVVDTAALDAGEHLRATEPALAAGLERLRDRVRANPDSMARIAHQYSMKNTMGYGLNSFTDFTNPIEILAHLIVGSEGTLGFVASATFRTVKVLPAVATGLLVFPQVSAATDALQALLDVGARTLELMDPASLRVVAPSLPPGHPLTQSPIEAQTALLVEMQAEDAAGLSEVLNRLGPVAARLPLVAPAEFTSEIRDRAALWALRKGLYTAVAGARPVGTTALLEDIVVPVPALTRTMSSLNSLFRTHGYEDAVVFGHAKDGNLHFMISPRLDDARELTAYETFTEDLVDLVLGENGSLKAEHGTGRIMAPFVRRQFGDELYAVMREVKALFDPVGVLNPGVLLSDDPHAHVRDLKAAVPVDSRVDACVECGYCEPGCPSKDVTTTPRQRIALMRTIAAASGAERRAIERDFDYAAVDTCAADSLCVVACPVKIDTGRVMKSMRARRHTPGVEAAGAWAARHWAGLGVLVRVALRVASWLPPVMLTTITRTLRRVVSPDWMPLAGADLPGPGRRRVSGPTAPGAATVGAEAVFFPSCTGSMFAPDHGADGTMLGASDAFTTLCDRAGVGLIVPAGIPGLCCGTVWQSKGLTEGHRAMAERTFEAVWAASQSGSLPVVCDAASCTHGLHELGDLLTGEARARFGRLTILDVVTFVRDAILPRVVVTQPIGAVAVHPTCSTVHLSAVDDLTAVAAACATQMYVPPSWGCCAFAGDRGLLHPELTASATGPEAADILAAETIRAAADVGGAGRFDAYVSANRTCEMGISRATGRQYVHVVQLVEHVTRPRE